MEIKNEDFYVVDLLLPSYGFSVSLLLANFNLVSLIIENDTGLKNFILIKTTSIILFFI